MAKIKYVARYQGEIVGTRSSDRAYTHAVVTWGHGKTADVPSWCGSLRLAQNKQREYQRYGYTVEIVEVESVNKLPSATRVAAAFNDAIAGTALGASVRFVPGN
jgi:hypothetical protein